MRTSRLWLAVVLFSLTIVFAPFAFAFNNQPVTCDAVQDVNVLLTRQFFENADYASAAVEIVAHGELLGSKNLVEELLNAQSDPSSVIRTRTSPKCLRAELTPTGFVLVYAFDWRPIPEQRMSFSFAPDGKLLDLPQDDEFRQGMGEARYQATEEILKELGQYLASDARNEKGNPKFKEFVRFLDGVTGGSVKSLVHETPRAMLLAILQYLQTNTLYGHPPTISIDENFKYFSDLPRSILPLTPAEAAGIERRDKVDLLPAMERGRQLQAEQTMKLNHPSVVGDYVLHQTPTRMFVPVLDTNAAQLKDADRSRHYVRHDLPATFTALFTNSLSAVLVQYDGHEFGLLPESYFMDKHGLIPASQQKGLGLPEVAVKSLSVDEFAVQLPQTVAKAAVAVGMDPDIYKEATAYIISVVRTCASITPKQAQKAMIKSPFLKGEENLRQIGDKYENCHVRGFAQTDSVRPWNREKERPIVFVISPNERAWLGSTYFTVRVLFGGMKDDRANLFTNYEIFAATIPVLNH